MFDRQSRRHDDDAQFRPHRLLHQADHAEGQVAFQAALVELVEDDDAGRFEERVVLQHPQQNAGRHHEDARLRPVLTVEAHLIADLAAESAAAFGGHAAGGGAGGQAARLQHHHAAGPGNPGVQQRRRHARRLAGAGRGAHHHGRPAPQGRDHIGKHRIDRQGKSRQRVRHESKTLSGGRAPLALSYPDA